MADFSIKHETHEDIQILNLKGYLDSSTANELELTFNSLIEQGKEKVVIVMTNLKYISSSGLGVFMAYVETLRERDGDIKFSNIPESIFNIFDLLGFPLLYEFYEDKQDAIASFNDVKKISKVVRKSSADSNKVNTERPKMNKIHPYKKKISPTRKGYPLISSTLIDDSLIFRINSNSMDAEIASIIKGEFTLFASSAIDINILNHKVDLSRVNYMDSSGLSALLLFFRILQSSEGNITLLNPTKNVKTLIEISQLNRILPIAHMKLEDNYFTNVDDNFKIQEFVKEQRSANNLINYAIELIDNKYKIVPVHSGGIYKIDTNGQIGEEPIIALPSDFASVTGMFWKDEIEEFEFLINKDNVLEIELQSFFESHPNFIINSAYNKLHSGIILQKEEGSLVPDFFLEPFWSREVCDILELKLPTQNLIVGSKNRMGFSHAISRALYQLREYSEYFNSKNHREYILNKYGISAFKPKLHLVIGRSKSIDPLIRKKAEADFKELNIITYDDILLRAKNRMLS